MNPSGYCANAKLMRSVTCRAVNEPNIYALIIYCLVILLLNSQSYLLVKIFLLTVCRDKEQKPYSLSFVCVFLGRDALP